MKKVVFCTNLPSPYRVDFFNELGKNCALTVLYERKSSSERDDRWVGEKAKNFTEVYLDLSPVGVDRSKGNKLRKYIATHDFDILFFSNYVSSSVMEAILYCRIRRIPYLIEYDGGFNKKDKLPLRLIKKLLLGGARYHFTTSDEHIAYLQSLGINKQRIIKYPFSSVHESEVRKTVCTPAEKEAFRKQLGMTEQKIVLSVGRFIPIKAYDVLIESLSKLPSDVGLYIVGGVPTPEYIELKQKFALDNLHFVDFKSKEALRDYYQAADLFAMTSRGDVWGLVVNEAMAQGLPVVSSDHCIAGLEMVEDGANGFVFPVDDVDALTEGIRRIIDDSDTMNRFANNALITARRYTIESMA